MRALTAIPTALRNPASGGLLAARRVIAKGAILWGCWTCLPALAAVPAVTGIESAQPPTLAALQLGNADNLAYFAAKVRAHQPVVVGYLGGSITQGSGASSPKYPYRALSGAALKAEAARRGTVLSTVQAAVGGTTSIYGSYRIGAQLLVHHPDLLIVEYAVNDYGKAERAQTNMASAREGMEAIVRQARRDNPKIGIVFFYTTAALFQDNYYAKGLVPESVLAHHQVAQHYGLMEVITGPTVHAAIQAGTFTNKTAFPDGTHPSDGIHALYAKILTEALLPAFNLPAPSANHPTAPVLPPLLGEGKFEYAHFDAVAPLGPTTGWNIGTQNWYGVPKCIAEKPAHPLVFKLKGEQPQLIFLGALQLSWESHGRTVTRALNGQLGRPSPASFEFPADELPEGNVTVQAVATAEGKINGEVWGFFSIQKP